MSINLPTDEIGSRDLDWNLVIIRSKRTKSAESEPSIPK